LGALITALQLILGIAKAVLLPIMTSR